MPTTKMKQPRQIQEEKITKLLKCIKKLPRKELIAIKAKHQNHYALRKEIDCLICRDSNIELDICSIIEKQPLDNNVIIGEKVLCSANVHEKVVLPKKEEANLLFETCYDLQHNIIVRPFVAKENKTNDHYKIGVMHYQLSDPVFINNGCTLLPTEKIVRKMNLYRMYPAQPQFNWFTRNSDKRTITYDSGEIFTEFGSDGSARCFYRNHKLALIYYNAEELNAQKRYLIYSSGEPDNFGRSRPITVLATFDYLGNGIVYDHFGKIRLKYDQSEGVVLDKSVGPISRWKWHSLNDPPVLQRIMMDTKNTIKDPIILSLEKTINIKTDDEEMLAVEYGNFLKDRSKKVKLSFKPFQIKMKTLKINEYFSLKVLDQATIYLIYRDGTTNFKLNIGMVLDHKIIIDTQTADFVTTDDTMQILPARSPSMEGVQRVVMHARNVKKLSERHQRWLIGKDPMPV